MQQARVTAASYQHLFALGTGGIAELTGHRSKSSTFSPYAKRDAACAWVTSRVQGLSIKGWQTELWRAIGGFSADIYSYLWR